MCNREIDNRKQGKTEARLVVNENYKAWIINKRKGREETT